MAKRLLRRHQEQLTDGRRHSLDMNQSITSARRYTYSFWKNRVEETRAKAQAIRDPSARQTMFTIVQMYEAMAKRAKAAEGLRIVESGP